MLIVYTKEGCPWCNEVRDFLIEQNISFEEREVLSNPGFFDELKNKSNQTKIPTFDIDGKIFSDLGKEEAEEILKDLNII